MTTVESSTDHGVTWATVPDPPDWVRAELDRYLAIVDVCNGIRWRVREGVAA